MNDTGPMDYIHQTVVHQLRHAADKIENSDGIVADFDYDEDLQTDDIGVGANTHTTMSQRNVELNLQFILPE
jgi:hypothetical protein